MTKNNIKFILVQIDEAHSSFWPVGLPNHPKPQKSFHDRIQRAKDFTEVNNIGNAFSIMIDGWTNTFAETFRAWPDKYYLINNKFEVLAKSEYGSEGVFDALIKTDCTELICNLVGL